MQLIFLNASPRGKKSNTDIMMGHFLRGFLENKENSLETLYLVKYRRNLEDLAREVLKSEVLIIGFPLYADSVPGSLKEFLEVFARFKDEETKPALGYFSQCGFPETHHLRFVERYLEKMTGKLNCSYLGSIMKGGGEGQHIQPQPFMEKTFYLLHKAGKDFGDTGTLNSDILQKLARPETLSHDQIKGIIPYVNEKLWDAWMIENGALEKSFDAPYK